MRRKVAVVLGCILLAVLVPQCAFTVDPTEFVYLTQFGRYVATYDGADAEQAGLHFRWPWPVQSVVRVDRRLQVLDLPAAELVTKDPLDGGTIDKTLAIDAYVVWRVPDAEAAERFILSVGSPERAREILRDRLRGRLGAAIAGMQFEDLISDGGRRVDEQREKLRRELLRPYGTVPAEDGIEIVDIRLRRLNYPEKVREAIFKRIISERNRKVAHEQSKGRKLAEDVKSRGETDASILLEAARAENNKARARAESAAFLTLKEAVEQDPSYYAELKRREIGLAVLDGKKRIFSTRLFDLIFPSPGKPGAAVPPVRPMGPEEGR